MVDKRNVSSYNINDSNIQELVGYRFEGVGPVNCLFIFIKLKCLALQRNVFSQRSSILFINLVTTAIRISITA